MTDGRGRFQLEVAAKRDGYYSVAAFLESRKPAIADDCSCPLFLHTD